MILENLTDAGTLAASPAMLTALPVTNLQEQARELVARTSGLSTQTIDLTLAAARQINACVLYRGNFTADATWRVKVYDTAAMGTLLYDSDSQYIAGPSPLGDLDWGVDPLGVSLYDDWDYSCAALWFTPVIGAFVRITLDDAANPDGYMEASRLFVGSYVEPTAMPLPGMTLEWRDTSTLTRTDGGTLRTEAGAQYRALSLAGAPLAEADRVALLPLLKDAGLRGDVYVSVFAGENSALERDNQMQAKLVAIDGTAFILHGYSQQVLRFEEI